MNTFSGKGKIGILAVFAVLLMPLLGISNASAIEVNDQVTVLVPNVEEFPAAPVERMFTCRAITDHAVWLVQNTSYVDDKGGFADSSFVPKEVWGTSLEDNMVTPDDFNALTASFESNVWGTVTSDCGVPLDLDSDGKVVVVLAAIPTKYNTSSTSQGPRNNMYYADPEFNEIEGVATELFFVNIHPYSTDPGTMVAAVEMREWNLANGLATLSLQSMQADEEAWLIRGIADVMQYRCFGFTETTASGAVHGTIEIMKEFRKQATLELINAVSSAQKSDYGGSRGQSFLWFMYLAQREGDSIISTIAKDDANVGMLSIAYAIDPSAVEETAVQDNVVPLYFDWLVCNLHNDFRSDFGGGIYMYDFLAGTTLEDWAHAGLGTAFTLSFNSYPITGTLPVLKYAMKGPIWACQYCRFSGYEEAWHTYFNGQYSDGTGANSAVNTRWEGLIVKCDNESGEFVSIESLTFDDLYNTSFTLTEPNTYIILTNNNPGGAPSTRYYISNDEVSPETESALHQNSLVSQYITTYCALVDKASLEIEGYDWVGPIFEATLLDSVLNMKMTPFYGGVYTGTFSAWSSGNYELSFSGYDSTGHFVQGLKNVAVGFADTDVLLELDYASLNVQRGGAPSGSMITLAETGTLGLAVATSSSIQSVRGEMTGIIAGPVSIPSVTGTLSFNSTTSAASVYRYTAQGWEILDSWLQDGKITATVVEGGIYALGEGIGVYAPEIPAQLVLAENAPNPFIAQTAISFGLPVSGNVRLNVFDMTGRLVSTIANEEMAAANHTIIWDGTDASGTSVGAGVYFCRLETAGQVLTQKMLKVQ